MTITDYISREAAIEAIGEMPLNWTDSPEELQEVADWEEHLHAIMAVPAADVRPVVRGEWKTAWLDHEAFGERPRVLYCSACEQVATIRTPFCPHCGADMRRKWDGTDV